MGSGIISGERIVHRLTLSAEPGAVDVGRLPTGELLFVLPDVPSAIEVSTETALNKPVLQNPIPRFFDPAPSPEFEVPREAVAAPALASPGIPDALRDWTDRVSARIVSAPRRVVVSGVIVLVAAVAVGFLMTPSGAHFQTAPTPQPSQGLSTERAAGDVAPSDPIAASITFAQAGELPGLGDVAGLPRSAFTAVITSRSGDIVLIDVYVNKPSGQKTFATVLLQKAGTQWRMREVFDARG